MRISDWSSDVCSSDLPRGGSTDLALVVENRSGGGARGFGQIRGIGKDQVRALAATFHERTFHVRATGTLQQVLADRGGAGKHDAIDIHVQRQRLAGALAEARQHIEHTRRNTGLEGQRTEEHTSELQSLMRLSYACFCLQKKK